MPIQGVRVLETPDPGRNVSELRGFKYSDPLIGDSSVRRLPHLAPRGIFGGSLSSAPFDTP
jgi:hypothetical protein